MNTLEIVGQIADLKDVDYKNTLAVATLIELLIAKGVFSRREFTDKARELEQASLADILRSRRTKVVRPARQTDTDRSLRHHTKGLGGPELTFPNLDNMPDANG